MITLDDLRRTPNALAPHYSRFRVSERLLLTGHSHQAWPDVAAEGQLEAFQDAAQDVDAKWARASAKADRVADGVRGLLEDPRAQVALGGSTHELCVRFLSALDLRRRPRLVTTDGEFHSLRRQLGRLSEEGVEVVWVPAAPADTLSERLTAEVDEQTSAVLVSMVMFETSRIVGGLGRLAEVCAAYEVELLVDAYHALGVLEVPLCALGLENAWVVGGGYKYLQLGEGNCFLRLPPHADLFRPVVTGWFAEFGELADQHDRHRVAYPEGAARWAGATYDPTSHYRAARVFEFRAEQGLKPAFLRQVALNQVGVLASAFDDLDLPEEVINRDRSVPTDGLGGFLALSCTRAPELGQALGSRGVQCDTRGEYVRLGPAPYLSDAQLLEAMATLGDAVRRTLL